MIDGPHGAMTGRLVLRTDGRHRGTFGATIGVMICVQALDPIAATPLTPLGALSRSALTPPPAAITSPARAAASLSTQSPATSAHAAPAASANRVAPGRDEVAQLEARVAKLEEWRRQVEG